MFRAASRNKPQKSDRLFVIEEIYEWLHGGRSYTPWALVLQRPVCLPSLLLMKPFRQLWRMHKHSSIFFLRSIAQGKGLAQRQDIVLNSTILPFDIASDTPFYNDELFREYADRTFSGGVEGLQASAGAFLSERFSSQYRVLLEIVTANIDQNHPEITNSLNDLAKQQSDATTALNTKLTQLDQAWSSIAASRGLVPDTLEYDMQYATWVGQVRYSDQIRTYSQALDGINAQIDATRRKVYSQSEIAALDNYGNLSDAYSVARPWTANVERSYKADGAPLTELLLANPKNWVPAMFDASPLVFPIGDLIAFLSGNGLQSFSTSTYSYTLNQSQSSWNASGGGSFLGWHLGGGGSGSSSMSTSMTQLNSLKISFANIAEYLADRSAWFNPGVLQDPTILKLVKGRPELAKLQYIAVSLIIARGITLELTFSNTVNSSDWSKSNFSANGGASFLGFSFGAQGGRSTSNYNVSVNSNSTTVTIQDDPSVARVLGARVEPFLAGLTNAPAQFFDLRLKNSLVAPDDLKALRTGKMSYMEYQKRKLATAAKSPR